MNIGTDVRSLHFLPFPTVRLEYFNPVIERQVKNLQSVIELARTVRERNVLPLKVCHFFYSKFRICTDLAFRHL